MSEQMTIPGADRLGFPVEVSEIHQKLAEMLSPDPAAAENGAAKASLLNFVLYDEDPSRLGANSEAIEKIAREFPCRSLLVCSDPDRRYGDFSRTWVQAVCQMDRKGAMKVCSEQISFLLSGNSPTLVRNTIFSHLDSDLPLVLWWRGNFSRAFEDRLYSGIDRLIIDSSTWKNPGDQFGRIVAAKNSGMAHFSLHDLSFTRLNAFRHAISNAFDLPSLRSAASKIEAVKIRFPAGERISALYLSAWIGLRLQGTLDSESHEDNWLVYRGRTPFSVELIEAPRDFAVAIRTGDLIVEVVRHPLECQIRTRVFHADSHETVLEDWLPNVCKSEEELIQEILGRGGRNRTLAQIIGLMPLYTLEKLAVRDTIP